MIFLILLGFIMMFGFFIFWIFIALVTRMHSKNLLKAIEEKKDKEYVKDTLKARKGVLSKKARKAAEMYVYENM